MKTLIKHAKIYTLDSVNTITEALVMENGRILKTGTEAMLRESYQEKMKEIDCEGRCILPAFHDSHIHLLGYGLFLEMVDLSGTKSIEELQQRIRQYIIKNRINKGEWIRGRGWNQDCFIKDQMPCKEDLDAVSREYPIVISRVCGHILVVNSKALEICKITEKMEEIPKEQIGIGEDGLPNGIFRENGMDLIYSNIPDPDLETLKRSIVKGQEQLLAKGITAVQSDDFGNVKDYKKVIQAFKELEKEKKLQIKVYEQCNFRTLSQLKEFLEEEQGFERNKEQVNCQKDVYKKGHFRLGCLKIVGDGSLGARTAWLRRPYKDAKDKTGIACYDLDSLYSYMSYAHKKGIPIAIHCIGDAMIETAVQYFARLQEETPRPELRHEIVHCQITDLSLLQRIAKQGILVSIQPIFLNYDLHIVEARVGRELAQTSYNWKTLLEYGCILSMGTDCPVEEFDPMKNIYCAVTRKDLSGYPSYGFYAEQNLSVQEAVMAYTMGSAYAAYGEKWQGSLEAGKCADLVVLNQDIFQCEMEEIKNIDIWKTFVEGEEIL